MFLVFLIPEGWKFLSVIEAKNTDKRERDGCNYPPFGLQDLFLALPTIKYF